MIIYIEAKDWTIAFAEMWGISGLLQINGHIVRISQLSELRWLNEDSES